MAAGRPVIVTGGTGLYFKALLEGLSEIPEVADEIRAAVRAATADVAAEQLHEELARRDPATAATLRPTDRQRIVRALEVFQATGRPLVSFQGERHGRVLDPQSCLRVFLAPDRDDLYARIDARFDAMVSLGALEEVKALASRGTGPGAPRHAGPWRAVADQGAAGRDGVAGSHRAGQGGYAALRQAAVHLVPPPGRGLALADAGRGGAGDSGELGLRRGAPV